MAKQVEEFWLIWNRNFSDQTPPSLKFIDRLENNRSSGDILQAMEDDISFLNSRKTKLEEQLDQIQFCLSWINEQKESIQSDHLEKVTEEISTDDSSDDGDQNEKEEGDDEEEEEHVSEIDVSQRRRKRSNSMFESTMLTALQTLPRRRSDASTLHRSRDQRGHLTRAGLIKRLEEPHYQNVGSTRSSSPVNWPLPKIPGEEPLSSTYQRKKPIVVRTVVGNPPSLNTSDVRTSQHSLEAYSSSDSSTEDNIYSQIEPSKILESDIISFLCNEMTSDDALVVVKSIQGTNVKRRIVENKETLHLLIKEYVSKHTLDRFLMVLYENKLYDLFDRAQDMQNDGSIYFDRNDVQRFQTASPRLSGSGGSHKLFRGLRRLRMSSGSECSPEGIHQTPPSNQFQFGVTVTSNLYPTGGTDPVPGQYRKLVLVRGQKMDVIGFYQQGTPLESYIARNSEGEIGLVPKEYCQMIPEADPIIWQREWYAKPKSEKTAKELIHDSPVGSFFIRDCQQKPGSLTLTVNLDGQIGKFIIEVDKSSYYMENSPGKVFGSLDQLINYYQHHTLKSGKEVYLTKPSKH